MENKFLKSFLEKSKITHLDRYDYSEVVYKNINEKVIIICNIHGEFLQTPKNHQKGHGCKKCAIILKASSLSKGIKNFITNSSNIHKNKYDYSKSIYVNNRTKLIIICPIHGEYRISPSHHYKGHGCTNCSNNYRRSNEEFIKICNELHSGKYLYELVKFTSLKKKIKILCKEHGEFFQNAGHHINGHGCPMCSSSHGEKYIKEFLDANLINYKKEKKFELCKNNTGNKLRFDFYLPDYNLCIEYDGKQHFECNEYFGGEKAFSKLRENDEIKNQFCKLNGIELLRVKYLRPSINNKNKIFKIIEQKINKTNMKN